MSMNYLLDLERTVRMGVSVYWKANERGYTRDIGEAGLYNDERADRIVSEDLDERTIKIPFEVVRKILS